MTILSYKLRFGKMFVKNYFQEKDVINIQIEWGSKMILVENINVDVLLKFITSIPRMVFVLEKIDKTTHRTTTHRTYTFRPFIVLPPQFNKLSTQSNKLSAQSNDYYSIEKNNVLIFCNLIKNDDFTHALIDIL